MPRDKGSHLTADELLELAETDDRAHRDSEADDVDLARQHAAACGACATRLQTHQTIADGILRLAAPGAQDRAAACPPDDDWARLCGGTLGADEATWLLDHAAGCDHCGHLLREVAESSEPTSTAEEQELLRQLSSSRPEWQSRLAHQLADMSGGSAAPAVAPVDPRFRQTWSWARSIGWRAQLAAAAVVVGVAAMLWLNHSRSSLVATNELLASAYAERRPFALRLTGARYGQVRERRAAQDLRVDRPQALLDADVQIGRGLAVESESPEWLQARGRAALLEGDWQTAVEVLERSRAARPTDVPVLNDLAVAYYERGDTQGRAADLEAARRYLDEALARRPDDLVALFNRALLHARMGNGELAIVDWQRYLQLDSSSDWRAEAKAFLAELTRAEPR